jgi:hypothetical protein
LDSHLGALGALKKLDHTNYWEEVNMAIQAIKLPGSEEEIVARLRSVYDHKQVMLSLYYPLAREWSGGWGLISNLVSLLFTDILRVTRDDLPRLRPELLKLVPKFISSLADDEEKAGVRKEANRIFQELLLETKEY